MSELPTPPAPSASGPAPDRTASPVAARARRRGLLWLAVCFLVPTAMCAPLCVMGGAADTVPDAIIVELDLEQAVAEQASVAGFGRAPLTSRDVVFGLAAAAKDPRVKGLYARVGGAAHGLGTGQDIRDAILAFRESGKPTLAFAETIGEMSPGTGGYYLASAFDEIVLQPAGQVTLAPLSAEAPFVRDGLEKLGVEPAFAARKEFKNAVNTFTEMGFTEAHAEATRALLTAAQRLIVDGVLKARPAIGDATTFTTLLHAGPITPEDALAAHLVDAIGYRDDALKRLRAKVSATDKDVDKDGRKDDEPAPTALLWLDRYLERVKKRTSADDDVPVVAVITAVGQIHRGQSNSDPFSGTQTIGADTLAACLRAASDDDDVKAILLRVDSPGGSVVASETIAHEVQRARDKGKKVVVSMANVAGSGGYYISMYADRIVAQPGTITGSIGVYAGKLVTARLFEQLGVRFATIAVDDADTSFFSMNQPYSETARSQLDRVVDGIYQDFVTKVATGRGKTFAEIEPVARGRIWAGSDAAERGLVDVLGGWSVAVDEVKSLLSLPKDAPVRLKAYPEEKPPVAALLAMITGNTGDSSDDPNGASAQLHLDADGVVRLLANIAASERVLALTPALTLTP